MNSTTLGTIVALLQSNPEVVAGAVKLETTKVLATKIVAAQLIAAASVVVEPKANKVFLNSTITAFEDVSRSSQESTLLSVIAQNKGDESYLSFASGVPNRHIHKVVENCAEDKQNYTAVLSESVSSELFTLASTQSTVTVVGEKSPVSNFLSIFNERVSAKFADFRDRPIVSEKGAGEFHAFLGSHQKQVRIKNQEALDFASQKRGEAFQNNQEMFHEYQSSIGFFEEVNFPRLTFEFFKAFNAEYLEQIYSFFFAMVPDGEVGSIGSLIKAFKLISIVGGWAMPFILTLFPRVMLAAYTKEQIFVEFKRQLEIFRGNTRNYFLDKNLSLDDVNGIQADSAQRLAATTEVIVNRRDVLAGVLDAAVPIPTWLAYIYYIPSIPGFTSGCTLVLMALLGQGPNGPELQALAIKIATLTVDGICSIVKSSVVVIPKEDEPVRTVIRGLIPSRELVSGFFQLLSNSNTGGALKIVTDILEGK